MKTCKVCAQSVEMNLLYSSTDYLTKEVFELRKCSFCSTVFTSPVPPDLGKFYHQEYRKYNRVTQSLLAFFYKRRSKAWMNSFNGPGRVLEIGCGSGLMLNEFKRNGWEVAGVERNLGVTNNAELNFGIKVYTPSISEVPEDVEYDLIILFQVLEHVEDIKVLFDKIDKLLSVNGRIVIGVPNHDSWQRRFGGSHWLHLDVPRHLQHFNIRSLELLVDRFDYSIKSVSMVSFEHDPFGWIQTIINKLSSTHNVLLLHLMRIRKNKLTLILNYFVSVLLLLPSLFLAVLSWMFKAGSNLEITVGRK